ncbi:unnamed protein product, partial [marine sediment metagenome]
ELGKDLRGPEQMMNTFSIERVKTAGKDKIFQKGSFNVNSKMKIFKAIKFLFSSLS